MNTMKETQKKLLNNYVKNTDGKENKINDAKYISEREKALMKCYRKIDGKYRSIRDCISWSRFIDKNCGNKKYLYKLKILYYSD